MPGKWFLRLIRVNGAPIPDPSVITKWLKESTGKSVKADTVWQTDSCGFCWQTPTFSKGGKAHQMLGCPLLATFNKVRKSASLAPIILSGDGVHASLQKVPVKAESVAKDVDKWQKEFRGMVSALEKRVDTLEKKVGVKRKADPPKSPPATKKSKKDQSGGKGKAKDEGSSQPKASGSGQSGSGKGKEKEKSAKRTRVVDNHD